MLYHSFVQPGGVVPHDLTVTAAMLYVVVVMRTSPEGRGLEAKVTEVATNWLREAGSPLEAFPRLSLCHALLAKLTPSSLLVETDPEGKSLLLQLFPITCHLFDRYMCMYILHVYGSCTCTYMYIYMVACMHGGSYKSVEFGTVFPDVENDV